MTTEGAITTAAETAAVAVAAATTTTAAAVAIEAKSQTKISDDDRGGDYDSSRDSGHG